MKISLQSDTELMISDFHDPDFNVVSDSPGLHFSAIEMFVASIAMCTYSLLSTYAEAAKLETHQIQLRMCWDYAEDPRRIGNITTDILWPALPESRIHAVQRIAAFCPLHQTLEHSPHLLTRINPSRPLRKAG